MENPFGKIQLNMENAWKIYKVKEKNIMAKKNSTKTTKNATGKWFKGIEDLQKLREAYLKAIKENHPDNGGSNEVCGEIISEYKAAFARLKRAAKLNGIEDEKERASAKKKWSTETDEKLREALWKVVSMPDVNIEVVGCWVWVDGNTYAQKDALKGLGYKWSKSRRKWHFTPYEETEHRRYGKRESFDTIRARYGSEKIENEEKRVLN